MTLRETYGVTGQTKHLDKTFYFSRFTFYV